MQDFTTVMKQRKPGPTKTKFTKESPNPLAFAELCFHLNNGEYSRKELLELTGIADSTFRKWLRYLRNRKLVYICERRRTSTTGACLLIYTWGFEKLDVPVKRKTMAEMSHTYRVNKSLKVIQNVAR